MLEALILGIVQGLTEFFPVSSTAHLILIPDLFHFSKATETLSFDVALHGGTFLALVMAFWRDWLRIIKEDRRLLLFVVLATIPAGVAGVLLEHKVETTFRTPLIIASSMIVLGIVMLFAEKKRGGKEVGALSLADAMAVGFAQVLALIPGVSRSGITITAGLFMGMKREEAARFSFLLSVPVVAGAVILEGRKIFHAGAMEAGILVPAVIASAVTGLFAIKFLLRFLEKHPINAFAYYRVLLGAFIIFWWFRLAHAG
ncbi:MAG: undecaprenyl-diphosphate phosphatase [Nitrospiraceae bacterium]|nr:undecaprenyl-diphosphate phosphatase [Nitrospiraceae bacterium]